MNLSRWWPALAASWRRHRSLLIPAYLGGLAVCLLAAIAGEGLHYYVDFRDGGGRFNGLMSLASGFCFVAAGWSLLLLSHSGGDRRERLAWAGAGILGIVLAFDEVAQFHEAASQVLARRGVPTPFGADPEIYVFALYVVTALVLGVALRPQLRRRPDLALPVAIAAACFMISQGFDALPWESLSHETQQWVGAGEEGFKCLGSWSLALAGLVLHRPPPLRPAE